MISSLSNGTVLSTGIAQMYLSAVTVVAEPLSMVERAITVTFATDSGAPDDAMADALGRAIWLVVYGAAPRG
ncbi:hypothetical protein [Nocardia australiensis]|uniref:hypothetical protein n=1 Tax=Nocardia australiensis TaxID=2887191 RepID=UPI001D14C902|nr:hypothetical protein [Nocardia australiensis]